MGKAQKLANDDYALFLADHKEETLKIGSNGKPRWDGSAAEQFLRVAVADGITVKPAALQASQQAYGCFNGTVFRNHIYQEQRTQKYIKNKFPDSHKSMVGDARAFAADYKVESEV